jgi:hypothetical protein
MMITVIVVMAIAALMSTAIAMIVILMVTGVTGVAVLVFTWSFTRVGARFGTWLVTVFTEFGTLFTGLGTVL